MPVTMIRLTAWGVLAFLALVAAQFGRDAVYSFHMALASVVAALFFLDACREKPTLAGLFADDDSGYQMNIVRLGVVLTVFWGVVGFAAGVGVASQLAWPELNYEPYLTFGRLRPLHTSAVIFAFGGGYRLYSSRCGGESHQHAFVGVSSADFSLRWAKIADSGEAHLILSRSSFDPFFR